MTARRRRQAGEGCISEYATKAGPRYLIKFHVDQDGQRRQVLRRGFTTRQQAGQALRDSLGKADRGEFVEPSKQLVGDFLEEWLAGLRLAPSTISSYRKNVRLHITPRLGSTPLANLTATRISALYRELEATGRQDHAAGTGLSPRTVRYVHTILRSALQAAVNSDRLVKNPADRATPPTVKQAKAPEMHTWSGEQLRAFLDWSREHSTLHVAWLILAMTGMRRGELLGLRWRDVSLDDGVISVRRSLGLVRTKGAGYVLEEGATKSGKARAVDVDAQTMAALRAYRLERASASLSLARDDALVFGDDEGQPRHPERFSRGFAEALARCARALGDQAPPSIRLHDLRHTHATLALQAGVHPKIVQERLGHANVSITLDTYSHALPTMQREAASKMAALIYGGA